MKKENILQSKKEGFVPVQYRIINLTSNDIVNSPTVKGTMTVYKQDGSSYERATNIHKVTPYTMDELKENSKLITVADDILFYEIRKLKGLTDDRKTPNEQQYDAYWEVKKMRSNIRNMKHADEPDIKRIVKEQDRLDKFLFVKDVISVENRAGDYKKFGVKGFYYGDVLYTRNSASSSNLKGNTVQFVRDDLNKQLAPILTAGHKDISQEALVVPEKYGAYMGLNTTGVTFVSSPRVCIIPDFEHLTFDDEVYFVTKKGELRKKEAINTIEYSIGMRKFRNTGNEGETVYMNSFDGMGLVDPTFLKMKWQQELHLSYTPSALNMRSKSVKGLVVTFPFKELAEEMGREYMTDILGRKKPIKDIDVILTISQWKNHALYDDDFNIYERSEHTIWGVQRVSPKRDKDNVKLNYQAEQTSNITSDEDVERLCKPTGDYFRQLADGEDAVVLFSLMNDTIISNEDNTEIECVENVSETEDDFWSAVDTTPFNKALLKNLDLLQDTYVRGQIKKNLDFAIKQAKVGKLYTEHNSNYQFMISDPYALAQWAILRDDIADENGNYPTKPMQNSRDNFYFGLIQPYHIYSKYWFDREVKKVDACRSPMTDIGEHNLLTVSNTGNTNKAVFEKMKKYYRYIYSGIIYSVHDISTVIHSDSDWDSDCVLTTDFGVLIDRRWDVPPVMYEKGLTKMEKRVYNVKTATESDLKGFGNKVGVYSNMSTNYFGMLPMFNGEEYTKIINQIKKLRFIIGEEIDSTKTGKKPDISMDFIYRSENKDISEEQRATIREHNKYTPEFPPYFTRYLDENKERAFQKYYKICSLICQKETFMTMAKLLEKAKNGELETEAEKNFYQFYLDNSPLLLTDCTMNKVCWYFEALEKELKDKFSVKSNNYILMSYAEPVEVDSKIKKVVNKVFSNYKEEIHRIYNESRYGENCYNAEKKKNHIISKREQLIKNCRKQLEEIVVNPSKLFNIVVAVLKTQKNLESVNKFLWNIFDEDIVDIIPEGNRRISMYETPDGEMEILGRKFHVEEETV